MAYFTTMNIHVLPEPAGHLSIHVYVAVLCFLLEYCLHFVFLLIKKINALQDFTAMILYKLTIQFKVKSWASLIETVAASSSPTAH